MIPASRDPPPASAALPGPSVAQRIIRAQPAVLLLVGGALALLAYLALPWALRVCPDDITWGTDAIANDCLALTGSYAGYGTHPLYAVDLYGPMGSAMLGLPLTPYLLAQVAYLGPAVLCLLAVFPALVARRARGHTGRASGITQASPLARSAALVGCSPSPSLRCRSAGSIWSSRRPPSPHTSPLEAWLRLLASSSRLGGLCGCRGSPGGCP
jgi:hypothetical protein